MTVTSWLSSCFLFPIL